jgi:nitrogen fixation/metabolism regulation signal transduction histidine kinase
VTSLLGDVENLSTLEAAKGLRRPRRSFARRTIAAQRLLVIAIALAVVLAVVIVMNTVRSISEPLTHLVAHARELSNGQPVRSHDDQFPGEVRDLAAR